MVSADAGFMQPACAHALVAAGADYLLALKANQPILLAAAQVAFATAPTTAPTSWPVWNEQAAS